MRKKFILFLLLTSTIALVGCEKKSDNYPLDDNKYLPFDEESTETIEPE